MIVTQKYTPGQIKAYLESPESQQWLINNQDCLTANQQIAVLFRIAKKYGAPDAISLANGNPHRGNLSLWLEEQYKNNPFGSNTAVTIQTEWLGRSDIFARDKFFQLLILLEVSFEEAEEYINEAYPYEPLTFCDWKTEDFCYHCCLAKGWNIEKAKTILDNAKKILDSDEVKQKADGRAYRRADETYTSLIIEKAPSEIQKFNSEEDVYRHIRDKCTRFLHVRTSPWAFFCDAFEDGLKIDSFEGLSDSDILAVAGYLVPVYPQKNLEQLQTILKESVVKQRRTIDRRLFIELLLINKSTSTEYIDSKLDDTVFAYALNVTERRDACVYEACHRAERSGTASAWDFYADNVQKICFDEFD